MALAHRLRLLMQAQAPLPQSHFDEPVETADDGHAPHAPEIGLRRFLIVTPVFNAEAFIDEAVASVLRQGVPGYSLHYHVQDGGSTDGTVDKLHAWDRRLREGLYIPHAGNIVFSFESERDGGMYDALQRGFARLAPQDTDILTWINSDDGLAQGALVTVGGVFEDIPGCEFLSGRTALLNEAGAVIVLAPALPYARKALADGLHDGRTLSFLMQEGTFFSGRVWNAVGGVDPAFRLAGDWDLWRRMARVAGHSTVDSLTGFHRRRLGQLSGDMDAYRREIDTAAALPDTTELSVLGTIVTFDQASARWIETAYDPAMLTAPALLRDGRPEISAVCRPVTGFAAPEGPYPQYQLPGGIRWIDGCRAEIAIRVRASGRYRLRLTLRASRKDIVIGLGIGVREPQPITLENPIPLIDQVIETVRWLEPGENSLFIDCNGPPDARSVLLIRCEATSTDEAFLRRPVLPPPQPMRSDRPALAIAVLCDDDEPDLLDLSLTGCAAVAPVGTAIFVVCDPQSAVLDRVVRARDADIAGCIDIAGPHIDIELLRQMLHAAGHDEVLILRRGSVMTPRGIDAASALLDATGAGAAAGFVDARDSMGASLHLSSIQGAAPVLYRATAETAVVLRLGCALAQAVARTTTVFDPPVIWVLDGDRPLLGRTPAALLAAGLALLGYDVRHVVVGAGTVPALPPGALVIASQGLADRADAALTIASDGGTLRLVRHAGEAVDLPLAVDTDLLLPRHRREARQRLGFAADERIVCIAEASAEQTATAIARVAAMVEGPSRILNFGHSSSSETPGCAVLALGTIADPLLLSYLLSAADAAVVSEPGGTMLAGAAWACGLMVLDQSGTVLRPDDELDALGIATHVQHDTADDACRFRDLIVATRSLVALATAIDERCSDFSGVGGSSPLHLRGGTVRVRSYRDAEQPGWFDPIAGSATMAVLGDALPFIAADGEKGLSIGGRDAEIVGCLDHADISGLRVHVRGTPGDTWTVHAGDSAATFCLGEYGADTVSVAGLYDAGPIRVRFERHGDVDGPLLHVVGLSAIGQSVSTTPGWEETKLALVPAAAWPTPTLEFDGDWQRVANFLPEEPAVPQEGLHAPFRWSLGDTCQIRVRTATGGPRTLRLALAAGVRDQRVRPVIAGRAYDWCAPLAGPIGHVERRAWLVDWPVGDIDITLEVSDVLRPPGQELGFILFEVMIDSAPDRSGFSLEI
ncbi:glycosyltransferase involved in cell wall biosynthesis [Sphingomonas sp. PP-CE-1G-424]|nr:glycosyltransferase involved in cell wall biosynthesis [Sphingomonas sp. PP-CE-1G-424]